MRSGMKLERERKEGTLLTTPHSFLLFLCTCYEHLRCGKERMQKHLRSKERWEENVCREVKDI